LTRLHKNDIVMSNSLLQGAVRKLAFLILPEFSHLGLAAAIEPLFVANWLAQRPVFEWNVISVDGKPVRASNQMMISVQGDLNSASDAKSVFVLASFEPHRVARERPVLRTLKRLARFGVELGGIENGSLILAAAGLLDGHCVAVHWDNLIGFREHYPATKPMAQLYARSRERITCAGASAILDMMTAWIGWHGEADLAAEVADHLLLGKVRAADTPQRGPAAPAGLNRLIAQAQTIMREHVDEPLPCSEIARRLGLSLRQLERRFSQEARCSVLQKYLLIRMTKAHQLLQQTPLRVTEVALACGFSSPEYFCRLYRRFFACSPSTDRRQSTTAPVLRQTIVARRTRRARVSA
jgi:AraC family transcriptional regulator, carnitine catabolism transcriptional activator